MHNDTILVTGGAGFIGSNFIQHHLASGRSCRIINLDKLTYAGNPSNLEGMSRDQRYTFIHGDICDRDAVKALLLEQRPAAILHFAAESHVDRSIHGPSAFIQTNVVGTSCLLEESRAYWSELSSDERDGFDFCMFQRTRFTVRCSPTNRLSRKRLDIHRTAHTLPQRLLLII
jgi:dTDP-glucose 4,6-dehydratase